MLVCSRLLPLLLLYKTWAGEPTEPDGRIPQRSPSAREISDSGVYAFATKCFVPKLKSLDLSFCSSISDDGVAAVAEKCTNLEYLNVAGLHRVTDSAARHITHNLWKLRTLNLEDLHLVTDAIFHFDAVKDGRIAASHTVRFANETCRVVGQALVSVNGRVSRSGRRAHPSLTRYTQATQQRVGAKCLFA